jgi:23S rRNA (cytosine1962-C5)-methyltransferase
MNFLRLPDALLSVLYQDDDIIAVDKPYGVNTHTNDSKVGNTDFTEDGLIEIYEKQLNRKLHIVHRLDQTTSGVIIFAKSAESAKKYAEYFFNRQVKKTYWFITAAPSGKTAFSIDSDIIHKGKELSAQTNFSFLKKSQKFSLWQANPLTGRNHQIRIHALAGGIPLLGDVKYEGQAYPFLCLHNHQIEFPNDLVITSQPPQHFTDLNLLENQILAKAMIEADRRLRLFSGKDLTDQCFRLVHTKNEFKDFGFTIDHFGEILLLSWYDEKWLDSDHKSFSYFSEWLKKPMVVRLMHNRGKNPHDKAQFIIGKEPLPTTWVACEQKIKYEIRSDSGQSFGLFLDQRLQRNWVLENSENKEVLNLFSYTCGFSAAAALGKAKQVTSVDTGKSVLNWGKKNFELNGLNLEEHRFLLRDGVTFLEQCLNKKQTYDLIICDPPSFSRGEKGVFKIEITAPILIKNCMACLKPGGVLLFSTNFENFYIDDVRKMILSAQNELGLKKVEINNILSALDYELPSQKPILLSFLIRNLE